MSLPATARLALALSVAAASAAAHADDLMDVYQMAERGDPQLLQAEAAYHAEAEGTRVAKAQLLPQLSIDANLSRERDDVTSLSSPIPGFGPTHFYTTNRGYNLNLTQALYRRDLLVQMHEADATAARAEAQYQAAQQELAVRATSLYFNVLSAGDNLDFAQAEKKAYQHLLEQAKQRFNVGLVAITDVHEAQAAFDLAVTREITAKNQLALAKEQLREITGKFPDSLQPLKDDIDLPPPQPTDPDKWVATALGRNYQLIAAQAAVDKARQDVELNRAGHYPQLNAVASYGYSDIGASLFGGSTTYDEQIGLQLNLPLYQGGGTVAKVRAAQYLLTQAKEAYEQQRRATDREARNDYLNVIDAINSVKALKQALVSTKSALDATQAGYEVGTRTIVDVLQSQRDVFDAQRNYAKARYDYVVSSLRLKQAAGILEAVDVEEINRWLK
jgi:outer membrane protein